jgi:hypothetical protein
LLLTFVIPVRHQDNAADWGGLKARLQQTIRSVSAQTHDDWEGIIVANYGADIPEHPRWRIERVTFPPNAHHDIDKHDIEAAREAVRLDKGRRVHRGVEAARGEYVMVVDDDDFVSRRLVEHAARGGPGWRIQRGYRWGDGGVLLLKDDKLSTVCGTTHIVRRGLYPPSPDESAIKTLFGSHRRIARELAARGARLEDLPFPGAIYRVGHVGAHTQSSGLLRSHLPPNLKRPMGLLKDARRFRLLTPAIRQEFFGG